MADPFRERTVTLTISTKSGGVFKVATTESLAAAMKGQFLNRDPTAKSDMFLLEHEVGAISVNLCDVEAINALIHVDAKQGFIERII